MKCSAVMAFLALSAHAATAASESANFDKLLGLVAEIQAEAAALAVLYHDKDLQFASLQQLCDETTPTPTPDSPTLEPTPVSTPRRTPEPQPEPSPTPTPEPSPTPDPQLSPTSPEPEPSPEPTPEPVDPTPSSPSSGWIPKIGDHWNYNLNTPVDTSIDVNVFFIDMDGAQETIDTIHGMGKVAVCYISIGTVEEWRDDASQFPSTAVGGDVDGWAGERWLDVKDKTVRSIMTERVEKAARMNCDAVEPDNMMAYTEGNIGVDVSEGDQIDYNQWFAGVVHSNGMLVGMKNSVELVPIMHRDFDFALNEECFQWDECDVYEDTFLAEGKPVFNVEYKNNMDQCDQALAMNIDSIVKNLNLDAPMCSCNDMGRSLMCDSVV